LNEFKVKEGKVECFLGIQIERNRKRKEIFLHEETYTQKILTRFNMENSTPITISVDPHTKLSKDMTEHEDTTNEGNTIRSYPYSEAMGSLMYLMTGTRPDC
jgi:hypothetical protein